LDLFLELAQAFPDEEFQIAGSLYDDSKEQDISELDNVAYLGWCDDMRSVYANTKLLLVPSTYQEGGGRVVIEAFTNGIPVIGSDLGGVPDYIGDGGDVVDDYTDPDEWIKTIETYLSDESYYESKSRKAKQRSQLFNHTKRVDDLERILTSTCSTRNSI
jgi:glycosyltransferase involved in cell wall biosynthesis